MALATFELTLYMADSTKIGPGPQPTSDIQPKPHEVTAVTPSAPLTPQEQELTALIGKLRLVLEQTLPDLDRRISTNRGDLVRLSQETTALDAKTTQLRTDRKATVAAQEVTRQNFDTRLNRHRTDINGLKKNLSGDIDTPLATLRTLHAQSKPLLQRLQALAQEATPDAEIQEKIDRHSSAIVGMQGHVMGLLQTARTLEDNVGRRLQVAQSDPRKLTLSCGEFIDKLNTTDGHLRAVISGFFGALMQHDRVVNDKNYHPNFHVVDPLELKKLGKEGFLPPEFKVLSARYAALYARANTGDLQSLLKEVVFMAAQYPEMVLHELQRILGGTYVSIDQDLLEQFANDMNFFFHSSLGLDCKLIPDGDAKIVHTIPSSHAPLTYVMGVPTAGRPAPDLRYTTFASGFSFTDTIGNRSLTSSRPPTIKVSQDHDE